MWVKLCCLLLYFLALFVLARVFEAVAWYESGFLATQLVDPVALSFRKLRTILECRGLGHSGLPEKKDVRELVEKSGTRSSSVTRGDGRRSVPGHPREGSGRPWMESGRCFPSQGGFGERAGSPPARGAMEGGREPRGVTVKARRRCELQRAAPRERPALDGAPAAALPFPALPFPSLLGLSLPFPGSSAAGGRVSAGGTDGTECRLP